MLTLLTFPGTPTEPSLSNFCTKAMILLHMAGKDFVTEIPQDMSRAFHGKLPALETPDGLVGDSTLMIAWLEARGADLFPGLSAQQRAQAHAVMRMTEENLRYGMMYHRWIDPGGWAAFKPLAFGRIPEDARDAVADGMQAAIRNGLDWQGPGRFTDTERMACWAADLEALAALLGQDDWQFGARPTAADAAVWPVLTGLQSLMTGTPLRRAVRDTPAPKANIDRGRAAPFAPPMTCLFYTSDAADALTRSHYPRDSSHA